MANKINRIALKAGNLGLDIAIWIVGIAIGLVPAIVMTLLYPNEEIISLTPFSRILSDVEVVYAFLSGAALLTIEQFHIDDINKIAKDLILKGRKIFIIIEIITMMFYISLKPLTFTEIEERLGGSIITLNKIVIIMSILIAVSLIVIHSLPLPNGIKREGKNNVDYMYSGL